MCNNAQKPSFGAEMGAEGAEGADCAVPIAQIGERKKKMMGSDAPTNEKRARVVLEGKKTQSTWPSQITTFPAVGRRRGGWPSLASREVEKGWRVGQRGEARQGDTTSCQP